MSSADAYLCPPPPPLPLAHSRIRARLQVLAAAARFRSRVTNQTRRLKPGFGPLRVKLKTQQLKAQPQWQRAVCSDACAGGADTRHGRRRTSEPQSLREAEKAVRPPQVRAGFQTRKGLLRRLSLKHPIIHTATGFDCADRCQRHGCRGSRRAASRGVRRAGTVPLPRPRSGHSPPHPQPQAGSPAANLARSPGAASKCPARWMRLSGTRRSNGLASRRAGGVANERMSPKLRWRNRRPLSNLHAALRGAANDFAARREAAGFSPSWGQDVQPVKSRT